jgi:hypothetical protein
MDEVESAATTGDDGRLKLFAFGNVARGFIAVGNVAYGVIAVGASLSVGVVAIGTNAVGSLVGIGLNAVGLVSLSLINGFGVVTYAGVNGVGVFGDAGVNSGSSFVMGLVFAGASLAAYFMAPPLGKVVQTPTPPLGDLARIEAGDGEGWVRAALLGVEGDVLQARASGRTLAVQAPAEVVAEAEALLVVQARPATLMRLETIVAHAEVAGDAGYRDAPAAARVLRCHEIREVPRAGAAAWGEPIRKWSLRLAVVLSLGGAVAGVIFR